MAARIRLVKDTTENWSKFDPVLLDGEVGIEVTPAGDKIKIGDGTSKWSELSYQLDTITLKDNIDTIGTEIETINTNIEALKVKDISIESNISTLTTTLNEVKSTAEAAYVKPENGIPKTDLEEGVQNSLSLADSALQDADAFDPKGTATSEISKLNKEDTAVEGEYVSSVSESAGIITVTRAPLPEDKNTTYIFTEGTIDGSFSVKSSDSEEAQSIKIHGLGNAAYVNSDTFLQPSDIAKGNSQGSIKVRGTDIFVKGLKSAAFTEKNAYATTAQGALADTALQKADITEGTVNGTISVDGSNVSVKGLGNAAYTEPSAYDASGTASTLVGTHNASSEAHADIRELISTNTTGIAKNKTDIENLNAATIKNNGAQALTGNLTIAKEGENSSGDLVVQGNLTVQGTTITKDEQTLTVQDNMIVTNSGGVDLTKTSGLAIKTGNASSPNEAFAIAYNPSAEDTKDNIRKGAVLVGKGALDASNEFTFGDNEGLPITLREDASNFTDNHLVKWVREGRKIADSGIDLNNVAIKSEVTTEITNAVQAETNRAETAEEGLRTSIGTNANNISKNSTDISLINTQIETINTQLENSLTITYPTTAGSDATKTVTYSPKNGTSPAENIIIPSVAGPTGPAGKGISSISITYQEGISGTTPPTGDWVTSIPTVTAGSYIWTKIILSFTDNTSSEPFYSIGRMGSDGAQGATGPEGSVKSLSANTSTTKVQSVVSNVSLNKDTKVLTVTTAPIHIDDGEL